MLSLLEKKLAFYCEELNIAIHKLSILLSFSGGIDSTVLASLLIDLREKYSFDLNFIHFNHNVHNKSKEMEDFQPTDIVVQIFENDFYDDFVSVSMCDFFS